jgi:hypothetical protein
MTNLSQKNLWLPEGQWFDFFEGEYYQGESWLNKYGDLSEIPLIAKAGAIIPLAGEVEFGNAANPEKLELQIFPGADNSFELYEDNGAAVRSELKTAKTIFKNSWQQKQLKFEILPLAGSKGVIPQNRSLELIFKAVNKPEVEILVDAKEKEADIKYDEQHKMLKVKLDYQPQSKYQINLKSEAGLLNQENNKVDKIKKLLKNFKLETAVKTELAKSIEKAAAENEGVEFLERFNSVLSQTQQETLIDLIYDCGSAHLKNGGTDQIVLFKGSLEELSYNFSKAVLTTGHHRSSLENDKGKVENYKLIDLKELEVDKWELTINYSDFIKKNYSSEL